MKYMLDTNICIYLIKHKPESVIEKFSIIDVNDVCISSITLSELYVGVEKSAYIEKNREALHKFLLNLETLDYGHEEAAQYGKIRASLEKKGIVIRAYDMMIAAHAMVQKLTLVTNNEKEFKRISGLKIVNWI